MAKGLKNRADKVMRANEEIDRLIDLPINKMRMELKHAFQDRKLPEEQFESLLDRLQKLGNISDSQIALARRAAVERKVDNEFDIELNSEEKTLMWAVVFARMMTTSEDKAPLSRSPLWHQMQKTIGVNNEEISMAQVIDRSLQNAETRFGWGQAGSWFYYNPRTNSVNIDLFYTFLLGFDHTRAVMGHELGHSELSNTYAKSMKDLYEKVKIVVDPSTIIRKDGKKERPRVKLSVEEYKELMLNVAEWQLRFQLWHVTEDTAVNQFSANMIQILKQELGRSWNTIGVVLQGFGEIVNGDDTRGDVKISTKKPPVVGTPEWDKWEERRREKQEKANAKRDKLVDRATTPLTDDEVADIKAGNITPDIAEKMFDQMNSAVLMAFYEQNGLFRGTDDNWERMRIIPEDVRRAVDLSKVPGAKGKDAFEYLVDLSVGKVNPEPLLYKIPMERERAKLFLAERGAGVEFTRLPDTEEALVKYLDAQIVQGQMVSAFRNLKASLPTAGQSLNDIQSSKRADAARKILAHPGLLGAEAANAADPVAALLAQRQRLPEIIDSEARKILAMPRVLGAAANDVEKPLEELFQQMARSIGIRNLQPKHADRLLITEPYKTVQDSYRAIVRHTSEQRGILMEHIWDTYLKPYADVILEARKQKIEKDLEKKKEKNKEKKKQQQQQKGGGGQGEGGGEGEGEGEGGEGGQPKPKPGEGEGEQNSGADAKPDISDDDDDNDGEGGQGEDSGIELDDDDYNDIGDLSGTPGEGRDNDNGSNDNQGDGFDQDDTKPGQGKKVGDLKDKAPIKETTAEQREAARKAAEDARDERFGNVGGTQAADLDVSQYAKGDWTDFYARIQELSPVIQHRERLYRKALAEQRTELHKQSTEIFSLLPRDGNFGRKDTNRILSRNFKRETRQIKSLEDLKPFRDDEVIMVDTSIESISLIDGSGSMNQVDLGGGVTAMDVALQSAVIDYMAARRAKVGGYIIMWGNQKPYVIATPNTPLEEVGKRLEGVRKGLNSATALSPALETSLEELGNFVTDKSTISGTSLMTIYSDGEIQDTAKAAAHLTVLTKNAKNLSIEVAILRPEERGGVDDPNDSAEVKAAKQTAAEGKKTEMEKVFDGVIKQSGSRIVSILHGHDAHIIPLEVGRSALKRLRKFKVQLEQDKDKRARFKKIARELKAGK